MIGFRETLKELKEMGCMVVIKQDILIINKKRYRATVKEIYPRNSSEREAMLSNYLEGLKSK